MSFEDLRDQGVLLPEREWGEHRLKTTLHTVPLLAAFAGAVAGLVLIWAGDGSGLTWAGVGLFLASLFALTWTCDRAVLAQRRRVRRERPRSSAGRS